MWPVSQTRPVSFEGADPEIYHRCLGPALFEPYAPDLARRVAERAGDAVLETACGTGILTRQLCVRLAPACRLVASDLHQPMLNYARARLRSLGRIMWERADYAALPFESASFGALACQFGMMFSRDKAAAVGEARRVLADGGLLAFNVWASMADNPYAEVVQETIARLLPSDRPQFFEAAYRSGNAEAWCSLLHLHDFEVQTLDWIPLAMHSSTAARLALGMVRGTPVSNAIQQRGGDVDAFVAAVAESLARLGGEAPFRSTMRALVLTAKAR
jgi:SAM-dependent methyltransferase